MIVCTAADSHATYYAIEVGNTMVRCASDQLADELTALLTQADEDAARFPGGFEGEFNTLKTTLRTLLGGEERTTCHLVEVGGLGGLLSVCGEWSGIPCDVSLRYVVVAPDHSAIVNVSWDDLLLSLPASVPQSHTAFLRDRESAGAGAPA